MTDNFLYALQRNIVTPSNMSGAFTQNGAGVTMNATGASLASITSGMLASSDAYLVMKRPVLLSGGCVRVVCTMRCIGLAPGRIFALGLSNGYPLAGRDVYGITIDENGELAMLYATGGVPLTFVTRSASFARALTVFDASLTHTYDLRVWPNGRVELRVDGELVHTLVASPLRTPHQAWLVPVVQITSSQVTSVNGGLELYSLELFSEREPAARWQTVTNYLTASTSSQVVAQLISPNVNPTMARIERIRITAGTGNVNFALGLTNGAPVGTPFTPVGEKVGSISSGLAYAQTLGNLAIGVVLPTEGQKVVWSRQSNGEALIHRSDAVASMLADASSLYASVQSLSAGGTVAVSVDYSVH